MKIIAIDPGTAQSAIVVWNGERLLYKAILPNEQILQALKDQRWADVLVIEWIESYGMAVGKEVFLTCRWCGRFEQAWRGQTLYLSRRMVKSHICHSARANDSNIRMALIDRFGEPGTKRQPNPVTYGLKKDLWASFALAVTYWDLEDSNSRSTSGI